MKFNIDKYRNEIFNNVTVDQLISLFSKSSRNYKVNKRTFKKILTHIYIDSDTSIEQDEFNKFCDMLFNLFNNNNSENNNNIKPNNKLKPPTIVSGKRVPPSPTTPTTPSGEDDNSNHPSAESISIPNTPNDDILINIRQLIAGLSIFCIGSNKTKDIFDFFDINNDGFLSFQELYEYLYSIYRVLYYTDLYSTKYSPYQIAYYVTINCFKDNNNKSHDTPLTFNEFHDWYSNSKRYDDILNKSSENGICLSDDFIKEAELMNNSTTSSSSPSTDYNYTNNIINEKEINENTLSTVDNTLNTVDNTNVQLSKINTNIPSPSSRADSSASSNDIPSLFRQLSSSANSPSKNSNPITSNDFHSLISILDVINTDGKNELFNLEQWRTLFREFCYEECVSDHLFNLYNNTSDSTINVKDIIPLFILFSSSSRPVKIQASFNYCYYKERNSRITSQRMITKEHNKEKISKNNIKQFLTLPYKLLFSLKIIKKDENELDDFIDAMFSTFGNIDEINYEDFYEWFSTLQIEKHELSKLFNLDDIEEESEIENSPGRRSRSSSLSLIVNEFVGYVDVQPLTPWLNVWSIKEMIKIQRFTLRDIYDLLLKASDDNQYITKEQYINMFVPNIIPTNQGDITNTRIWNVYKDIFSIVKKNNKSEKADIFHVIYCLSLFYESETPDIEVGKLLYEFITYYDRQLNAITFHSLYVYISNVIEVFFFINHKYEDTIKISKDNVKLRVTKWLLYQGDQNFRGILTQSDFLDLYRNSKIHLRICESISTEMCYTELPNLQLLLQLSQLVYCSIVHIEPLFVRNNNNNNNYITIDEFIELMNKYIGYYMHYNLAEINQAKVVWRYIFNVIGNNQKQTSKSQLLCCLAMLAQHSSSDLVTFIFNHYHNNTNYICYYDVLQFMLPFATLIYTIEPILRLDNLYTDNTPTTFLQYILNDLCNLYGIKIYDSQSKSNFNNPSQQQQQQIKISKHKLLSYFKTHNIYEILLYKKNDIITCKNLNYHINCSIKSLNLSYQRLVELFNDIGSWKTTSNKLPFKTLIMCYELIDPDIDFPKICELSRIYNYITNKNYFNLNSNDLIIILLLLCNSTSINRAVSIFKFYDVDNDNVISRQDLESFLRLVFNFIYHFILPDDELISLDYRINDSVDQFISEMQPEPIMLDDYKKEMLHKPITIDIFIKQILKQKIEIRNQFITLKNLFHIKYRVIDPEVIEYNYDTYFFQMTPMNEQLLKSLRLTKKYTERKSLQELKINSRLFQYDIHHVFETLLHYSCGYNISYNQYVRAMHILFNDYSSDNRQYKILEEIFKLYINDDKNNNINDNLSPSLLPINNSNYKNMSNEEVDVYNICFALNFLCKSSYILPTDICKSESIPIEYVKKYYKSVEKFLLYLDGEKYENIKLNYSLLNDVSLYTNDKDYFTMDEFANWISLKENIITKGYNIIATYFGITHYNVKEIKEIFKEEFMSLEKEISSNEFIKICVKLNKLYVNGQNDYKNTFQLARSLYNYISNYVSKMTCNRIIEYCLKIMKHRNPRFIFYMIDRYNHNYITYNDIIHFIQLLLTIEEKINNGFTSIFMPSYEVSKIIVDDMYQKNKTPIDKRIECKSFKWQTN